MRRRHIAPETISLICLYIAEKKLRKCSASRRDIQIVEESSVKAEILDVVNTPIGE
jgi:hypothetical protein